MDDSAGEPWVVLPQNPEDEWTEVGDIIADVLGSLPVEDIDGAVAAEAQAQEEVAIEPADTAEVFYDVQEYVGTEGRPSNMARK